MQRLLQEGLLGPHRWYSRPSAAEVATSGGSAIWVLGVCYQVSGTSVASDSEAGGAAAASSSSAEEAYNAFLLDFSSRVWITYRKGFESLGQSKLTSDVGWGCMLRSGQMLLAQALVCHYLGRSWRRDSGQPASQEYLQILQGFGDSLSDSCPFSIHNMLEVGKLYGLAEGSWLGPYALCRTLEALAIVDRERRLGGGSKGALPFAVHVVSGDADGERGGAPVLCVEDVARLCSEWGDEKEEWSPVLVLVPLVLGLDKVNSRYLPSLRATFTFPQSLGIAGGKPGASTYLIGVQDDQALYLDPHNIQKAMQVSPDSTEVDTSSYHCSVVKRLPLDCIDPSLALGFYCRNREEFDNLCTRSSKLAEESHGAPMFTVAEKAGPVKQAETTDLDLQDHTSKDPASEDDWQIL